MTERKTIQIYKVTHNRLRDGDLVIADSVNDAIRKFNDYYESDIDIFPDGITGVMLFLTYEVIIETNK
jgi:hypothetical protein